VVVDRQKAEIDRLKNPALHSYRERFGWHAEGYSHAMRIGRQTVSLPLSPKPTADDVEHIIAAVNELCR
jgi:dTDP-4-amino-4,6-dideoxygalactose transaminase